MYVHLLYKSKKTTKMIEFLSQTWAWYVSGTMIAFIMFLLLWSGGEFGVSSNLRTICAIGGAGKKVSFFDFDWKSQIWNLVFISGAIIGGFIATTYLSNSNGINISKHTVHALSELGISFENQLLPSFFTWENLFTMKGIFVLIIGGFLVGFGARWAGGCTSGHAISGLSNLQIPSLIAVVGFFIGGLIMTHILFPFIF